MPVATPATVAVSADALRVRLPLLALLALSAAACTDVVTDLLPAGLLPQMAAALRVPGFRIGYLVGAFAIASAAAAIPATAALRRVPRRTALMAALAGFALCNAVTAVSSSYPLTFAARLLVGVMGGTLWSMLAGYAARMVPASLRARAIAIVLAGITVALCLGVPAGAALAAAVGWRASFAVLAAVPLALIGWLRWTVPALPAGAAMRTAPLRAVVLLPGIRPVLATTALVLTAHQAMYTYIAPFARAAGSGLTSLVLLEFGVASAAGIWVTGLVADRRPRATLCAALTLIAAAMLALGLAASHPAVLLIAVAVWGAAFGGAPILLQAALIDASGVPSADVATAMQTTVYNAGMAAGALAGGLVLAGAGAGALPWLTGTLVTAALATVLAALRNGG